MTKIAVQLAPGFEEIEAITIIDVLRRAGLEVITVSMTGSRQVEGSHQIPVISDRLFAEVDYSEVDVIVLPGGMPGAKNLDEHEGLRKQLIQFRDEGKMLGAICAAPLVLGHLHLLEGEKAVCYPGYEKELFGAEILHEPAVRSGNIITGRGAGVAMKFALKLVEELVSKEKADELAKAMVVQ